MEINLHTEIQPVQMQKPVVKAAVQYLYVNFKNDEWATARILFLDHDNVALRSEDVVITAEESQLWEGDDGYILTLALQKLGIALLPKATIKR
jgi:hypothetical protein